MKWNKLTIETTTAAEDMLSYELSEMGMEGVEIEDHVPLSEEDGIRVRNVTGVQSCALPISFFQTKSHQTMERLVFPAMWMKRKIYRR